MIEKNFEANLKAIQIVGGTQFKPLMTKLQGENVVHRFTCTNTTEQN